MDPVPFLIYDSECERSGVDSLTEQSAKDTGFYLPHGYDLMSYLIGDNK
jgi:2,3-bisphosphoglycerate-independent phosphoglycerate mutase